MAHTTPGLYSRLLDFLERCYEVVILDLGTRVPVKELGAAIAYKWV